MKNGDRERTSSWAAKSRPSLPTVKVIIGEVRELFAHPLVHAHLVCDAQATYLPGDKLCSKDRCIFASFAGSLADFFNFAAFSTRSFDLKERLNMAAAAGCVDVEVGSARDRELIERATKRA